MCSSDLPTVQWFRELGLSDAQVAKVVARALRDGGHEVIYTGLRRTPEQIVRTVMDEDARFVGLSSLSGAHSHLFPKICKLLKESGLNDVVVFGGGIIPESDRPPLYSAGVRAIFGPGTPSTEILDFVEEASSRDCGVGHSRQRRHGRRRFNSGRRDRKAHV